MLYTGVSIKSVLNCIHSYIHCIYLFIHSFEIQLTVVTFNINKLIYRMNLKYPCTKITISQKCANIFVLNFANFFRRQLCKSVLLYAVFS